MQSLRPWTAPGNRLRLKDANDLIRLGLGILVIFFSATMGIYLGFSAGARIVRALTSPEKPAKVILVPNQETKQAEGVVM